MVTAFAGGGHNWSLLRFLPDSLCVHLILLQDSFLLTPELCERASAAGYDWHSAAAQVLAQVADMPQAALFRDPVSEEEVGGLSCGCTHCLLQFM
jgi:hypothetical protein